MHFLMTEDRMVQQLWLVKVVDDSCRVDIETTEWCTRTSTDCINNYTTIFTACATSGLEKNCTCVVYIKWRNAMLSAKTCSERTHTHSHARTHIHTYTYTFTCTYVRTCICPSQNCLRGPHSEGEPPRGNKTSGPIGSILPARSFTLGFSILQKPFFLGFPGGTTSLMFGLSEL